MDKPKFDIKSAISRGRIAQPLRVMWYGPEKIGKTSNASTAPRPLFLGAEDGSAHLDVARVTPDCWLPHKNRETGETVGERSLLDIVQWFGTPDASDYQTLVIDTIDAAEKLCVDYVCRRDHDTPEPTKKYNRSTWVDGKPYLDGYGYGSGLKVIETEFLALLAALDRARRTRSVHVVFTAHADVAREKNLAGDDYGIIAPKLTKLVRDQVVAWLDAVLYCEFARWELKEAEKDKKGNAIGKAKAITDGSRIVHTVRKNAWIAGNRLSLPETVKMGWEPIAEYAQAAYGDAAAQCAQMRDEIKRLCELVPEETRAKAMASAEKYSGSVMMLIEIRGRLQTRVAETANGEVRP